jgi:hypothetical protein
MGMEEKEAVDQDDAAVRPPPKQLPFAVDRFGGTAFPHFVAMPISLCLEQA